MRGHRIDLSEIEAAAHRIPDVSRACTLCYRQGQPEQRVLCYYSAAGHEPLAEAVVAAELSRQLPDYALPLLFQLTTWPLLVNGKV